MKKRFSFFLVISILLTACGTTGWKELTPVDHPPANGGGAVSYSTQAQTAVFLGGFLSETWIWDNGNWIKATPVNQPPPRAKFSMAYNASRNRIVIFGGVYDKTLFNDTWEWDGTNWLKTESDHIPPARCCHAMAYDSVQKKILLYGGWNPQTNAFYDDLWLWDGSDWTEVKNQEMPLMSGHKMASYASQIISTFTSGLGTWVWDGMIWNNLNIESPPDRPDSALVYDMKHNAIVLFGGKRNGILLNDTWVFDGESWSELKLPLAPSPRDAHVMFYDPKRQSIILFGGVDENGSLGNTWELRLP